MSKFWERPDFYILGTGVIINFGFSIYLYKQQNTLSNEIKEVRENLTNIAKKIATELAGCPKNVADIMEAVKKLDRIILTYRNNFNKIKEKFEMVDQRFEIVEDSIDELKYKMNIIIASLAEAKIALKQPPQPTPMMPSYQYQPQPQQPKRRPMPQQQRRPPPRSKPSSTATTSTLSTSTKDEPEEDINIEDFITDIAID